MPNDQNITKSISLQNDGGQLVLKVDYSHHQSETGDVVVIGRIMDAFERQANSMLASSGDLLSDAKLPRGRRHIASMHSIKVDGRTLRIRADIKTTRKVDGFTLICFADGLIGKTIPCIFVALKPEETAAFVLARFSQLFLRTMRQTAMDMYRLMPPSMLFGPFEATTGATVAVQEP